MNITRSGIYIIQSSIKPKRCYIGSAVNIRERWRRHLNCLRGNRHENGKLQNHFNKDGENDLVFSVLIGCEKEDLIKNEQFFIDSLKPWFNICQTAGSTLGYIHTKETKDVMRITRPYISEEARAKQSFANSGENNPMYGKPSPMTGKHHSKETIEKMRNAKLGKLKSAETKVRMSVAKQNMSKETKAKMSAWQTGRTLSEEHKKNISITKSGEKHPNYGKHLSAATKTLISESLKARLLLPKPTQTGLFADITSCDSVKPSNGKDIARECA